MCAKKKEKNYEMQVSIMFVSYMDEVSSRGRNRFGGKGWCTLFSCESAYARENDAYAKHTYWACSIIYILLHFGVVNCL